MRIDLSVKKALVTGSTRGIGFATARQLAGAGASVVVSGRTASGVEGAIQRIVAEKPDAQALGFVGDLTRADEADRLVAEHPVVDVLVNNLGIFGPKDFFDLTDEDWTTYFDANVLSGVRLARAYAPAMQARSWGRIVFVSSESALNIPADMVHYGVSKTAQLAVARGLAKRLAGSGVTVNSVLPGPTLSDGVTEMLKGAVAETGKSVAELADDFVRQHRSSSILQRAASVDEVAHMICYICSPLASATTGAALRVDGGVVDTIA